MWRGRPVGGRLTRMRCGRRWPRMTRCCAPRLRRTAAFCSSHTGDGVCAAFASPRSAVDAAVAAQRALELPVRMGLATGEAELRDGDYFGTVLNRAARVMAAGHGGQILLAGTDAGSAQRRRPDDLGPRRLRDIANAGRGVPGPGAGPADGVSAAADARSRRRETCARRPPASSAASPRSPRSQAALQGSSVGDVDRGGWGRQDPPGAGSRGAAGRRVPRRGLVFRTGRGHRSGGGARRGGGGAGHHPTTGQEP